MSSDPVIFDDGSEDSLELAGQLNLNIVKKRPSSGLFLHFRDGHLYLCLDEKSIGVDFCKYHHRFSVTGGFAKKALIAKAIGYSGKRVPLVFDLTMGLARDSFQLAGFCEKLVAVEKSSIMVKMVQTARSLLEKGAASSPDSNKVRKLLERIEVHHLDCLDFLNNYNCIAPEVIYIDPMFPEKKKSALPKKEMQILQELLPATDWTNDILDKSMQLAKKRVVVKRAPKDPELFVDSKTRPAHTVLGKSVRYDVYLPQLDGQ